MPGVLFVRKSANAKTGPIPVTYSSAETCPDACPLKANGCYASSGFHTRLAWDRASRASAASWRATLESVRALPAGQLWRHNVAGDLPGRGDAIDGTALASLAAANTGRNGYTYTHKPLTTENAAAIREANRAGFTVNLSADSMREADEKANAACGPVVVVVPADHPALSKTPAGRTVIVCPAQTGDKTCATCKACANPNRKPIIAFRIHGTGSKKAALALQNR